MKGYEHFKGILYNYTPPSRSLSLLIQMEREKSIFCRSVAFTWYNSQGTLDILLDTVDYSRTCLSDPHLSSERHSVYCLSISKPNPVSCEVPRARGKCPEHKFRRTGFQSWLHHYCMNLSKSCLLREPYFPYMQNGNKDISLPKILSG